MKNLKEIQTKQTISTMPITGERGLTGTFLILSNIVFDGEHCVLLKDFDGEGEETYIVHQDYILDSNYVDKAKQLTLGRDYDEYGRKLPLDLTKKEVVAWLRGRNVDEDNESSDDFIIAEAWNLGEIEETKNGYVITMD